MALEESRAKNGRAQHHLNCLERQIQEFLTLNPYPVVVEAHPEESRYIAKIQNSLAVPTERWSLIVGDCVHNMRSALDFITWELSGDTRALFPIYRDRAKFDKHGRPRVGALPPDAQALIESLQPYHAPDPTFTSLWAIHALDAADKHRLLTVIVAIQDDLSVSFEGVPPGTRIVYDTELVPNVTLENDAVITRITIVNLPLPNQVHVKVEFAPAIAFGETLGFGIRTYVLPNLKKMLAETDAIITRFAALPCFR